MIKAPSACTFCGSSLKLETTYSSRPEGETVFDFNTNYYRVYYKCISCGHFYSQHMLPMKNLYEGNYSDATYGSQREFIFNKIINLPAYQSDNFHRCERINTFAQLLNHDDSHKTILDVGSGLGIFPYGMKSLGWNVTALDPDKESINHILRLVGCDCVHADFIQDEMSFETLFNFISFNKVLEHVDDPLSMLIKAKKYLKKGGFIYIELPDAENAIKESIYREEFFIEHHHVFTASSLSLMVKKADLKLVELRTIKENSGKYTVYCFCCL